MSLEVFLGSVVISTVISALVAVYTTSKTNKLEYITRERCEWRKEIRICSELLSGSSYQETRKICDKLKVRINAWGRSVANNYLADAHIWKVIENIESEDFESVRLIDLQWELQEYLSLLLKWDWERSKKEVVGEKRKFLGHILWIISSLIYVGGLLYGVVSMNNATNLNVMSLVYVDVLEITALVIIILLLEKLFEISGVLFWSKCIKHGKISKKICTAIWIIDIVYASIECIVYTSFLYSCLDKLVEIMPAIVLLITVMCSLGGIGAAFLHCYWLVEFERDFFSYTKAIVWVRDRIHKSITSEPTDWKAKERVKKMEKEKKFAKDIFDFDLEKKIFKYLYYGKKRKLDKENQITSYMDWKHRIEKMYSSFSIEQLQDFSRWLNQKIRDSKPSHEYSQICITVLITWFLTKVLDEYCNRITNLKISFLAIVIFSIIVFFIVLYGCSKLYDMLFAENMKIALYTDYKEVIDDLISQKEKRG